MTYLEPSDLIFTRSPTFISWAIRKSEQRWGEPASECSHVAGVVWGGPYMDAVIVEALNTVKKHKLGEAYGGTSSEICIVRPKNISSYAKGRIAVEANGYVGDKYGYAKIGAHLLDATLCGGFNVFRRLCIFNKRPICSWVWAKAYATEGLNFGVEPAAAQPDDMLDFCRSNPNKYDIIFEWQKI